MRGGATCNRTPMSAEPETSRGQNMSLEALNLFAMNGIDGRVAEATFTSRMINTLEG